MLTWALTRQPVDTTLPLLLHELSSPHPQAVSQALHTLSKIGDARAYPHITDDHLHSSDDAIARTAWRAAVQLASDAQRPSLAARLATELGHGDRERRRSLSRALITLATTTTRSTETRPSDRERDTQSQRNAMVGGPGTPDSHPEKAGPESPGEAVIRVLERDGGVHARATLLMLTDSGLSFDTTEYRAAHSDRPRAMDHLKPMTTQQ